MVENRIAKVSVNIQAPASKVWDALTKPELVRQYLFGTEVITDWQVGSPIIYKGVWEGKLYEDKGKILHIEPGKQIVSTYWSPMSGLPDRIEYYKTVQYLLESESGGTRLTITQDNNASDEETKHSEENWQVVLEGIKKLVEAQKPD